MSYFEFRDKYLNTLIKLGDITHQICNYILKELYIIDIEKLYESCLIFHLIEFTHNKIQQLVDLLINATYIEHNVAMFKIVEAICMLDCYLDSIKIRIEMYIPKYVDDFTAICRSYIEEAQYLFMQLGCVNDSLLIVSFNKVVWENQSDDFFNIKAKAMEYVGSLCNKKNDLNNALKYFLEVLEVYRKIHDENRQALAMVKIGEIYFKIKNFDKAFEYVEKGLVTLRRIGENKGIILALYAMSQIVYYGYKKLDEAMEFLTETLDLLKKEEDKGMQIYPLRFMALIYSDKNDFNAIKKCNIELKKIYNEIGYEGDGLND